MRRCRADSRGKIDDDYPAAAVVRIVAGRWLRRCRSLGRPRVPLRGPSRSAGAGWSGGRDVAEKQVKVFFDGKVCDNPAGQQAFAKLVNALRGPAGLDPSVQSAVLSSSIPNAFALPGGKVFLFNGLLAKAENPDEIAGVLAHELGHLKHRDNMRGMIYNGGTSFLVGLLFGDITGSSALIFASRTLVTASHSREAEGDADVCDSVMQSSAGRRS